MSRYAYLAFYSEGHGQMVVGVFTGKNAEARAHAAGKENDWYGGDCAVERHRLNGPIEYGKSSQVFDTPRKKKAKK